MEETGHAEGKIRAIVDALDGIDRAAGYDVVVFTCSTNPKQPYSKATPHKDCVVDVPTDFSSDCIETTQEYWRIARSFCVI